MTDFLIMSAAFLILIPSSWLNEINGLGMKMRKVLLIGPSHCPPRKSTMKTAIYAQNMRRVGKPPYYVWGGQPAGLASPPIRRRVSARGPRRSLHIPIRRRRPRTAKHQAAVVFHPSSQPEEETTHG